MFVFMLSKCLISFPACSHVTTFEVPHKWIIIWSLIHSDKHCYYRNSVCDGGLGITICLLCTPLWTKESLIWRLKYDSVPSIVEQRSTLCLWLQDILLLKGTKYQLSVYDKIQILCRFSMSVFHFSSLSGPLQKDGLKNKINRMYKQII